MFGGEFRVKSDSYWLCTNLDLEGIWRGEFYGGGKWVKFNGNDFSGE